MALQVYSLNRSRRTPGARIVLTSSSSITTLAPLRRERKIANAEIVRPSNRIELLFRVTVSYSIPVPKKNIPKKKRFKFAKHLSCVYCQFSHHPQCSCFTWIVVIRGTKPEVAILEKLALKLVYLVTQPSYCCI